MTQDCVKNRCIIFTAMGTLRASSACLLLLFIVGTSKVTGCFTTVNLAGESGNLSSPGYPDPYPQDYDCQSFLITVSEGSIIRLDFDSFDLGDDDSLVVTDSGKNDALFLQDGGLPKDYYSVGNTLQLNFTSVNNNNNNTGFFIFYTETNRVFPSKGPQQSVTLKPGKPTLLRSVDFPSAYSDYSLYFWTVTSTPGTKIAAEILLLDTEENYDFLEFGNGNDGNLRFETRLERMSGMMSRLEVPLFSDSNEMWVLFESDYSKAASGFSVMLYEVPDAVAVSSVTPLPRATCGSNMTIQEGGSVMLSTPNFPLDPYDNDTVCEWIITGVTGLRINFNPFVFSLEAGYDFLDIGNGDDPSDASSRFLSLTGSGPGDPLTLESDQVWLRFRSDSSSEDAGVYATLEQPADCGGVLYINESNPTVTVSVGSYVDNFHCQWVIYGRPDRFISGNITSFSTEEVYDVVEVGTGANPADPSSRIKTISGSMATEEFNTLTNTLWVTFTSDGSNTDQGFSMTFSEDFLCGITTLLEKQGTVVSPGYPAPYPSNADCQWIVQARGGYNLKLTFNEFETEEGFDKLLIGGLEPQDPEWSPYYELSGNLMPDELISTFNGVSLRFVSDGSNVATGFSLNYEEIFYCPDGYEVGNDGETCYKFSLAPASWEDARDECYGVSDGDLLVINDQAEFDYIAAKSANISGDWWVGWYDQSVEGQWSWVDCQASTVWADSNWVNGSRGVDSMVNDCGMLVGSSGLLNDGNCSAPMMFVCETTKKAYTYSDAKPNRIRGTATSPSDILLSWRLSQVGCDLRGYQIRYNTTAALDQFVYLDVTDPQATSVEVSGLMAETNYLFEFVIDTFSYGLSSYRTAKSIFAMTEIAYEDRCTTGFVYVDGACFKFGRQLLSWEEARADCRLTPGANLAIIDNESELNMVLNLTGGSDWWIGLNDRSTEGRFRWTDCSDLNQWQSDQWADGQPDNRTDNEDCGQLLESGRWNDWDCNRPVQYICKIIQLDFEPEDVNPNNLTGTALSKAVIEVQWTPSTYDCDVLGYTVSWMEQTASNASMASMVTVVGGDMTMVRIDGLMALTTYSVSVAAETAEGPLPFVQPVLVQTSNVTVIFCPDGFEPGHNDICYKFGRQMATFEEARADCQRAPGGDLAVIEDDAEKNYILNKTAGGDWWIGLNDRSKEGTFRWTDCSRLTAWQSTQWAAGQPDDPTGTEDCVQFNSVGDWNDQLCDQRMPYVCEILPEVFVPEDANPSNFSVESPTPFSIQLSWVPSVFDCDLKGYAILWRIGDGPRQTLTLDGAETDQVFLDDLTPGQSYSFQIAAETFVRILPFSEIQNVTLSSNTTGFCPGDYEYARNGSCYKFVKKFATWDEARMDCQGVSGGDLVIIDDLLEDEYIMGRIVDGDWWIGFSDRGTEGQWQTVNCNDFNPWQQSNWAVDQPNDLSGVQDCAQLLETGEWNDWQCDRPMQYICEITPKDFDQAEQIARNLSVNVDSSTSVTVSWIPPTFTCDILSYMITYSTSLSIYTVEVEDASLAEITINDLRPLTRYSFNLETKMAMGNSGPSEQVVVNTLAYEGCENIDVQSDIVGNLSSPLFPNEYPRVVDCAYRIDLSSSVGPDARIRLRFLSFALSEGDSLEIREVDVTAKNYENPVVLKGRGPVKDYFSYGSVIELQFRSDAVAEGRGFSIRYTQYDQAIPGDKPCGGTYNIKPNSILHFDSTNYPNGYTNDQSCTWQFMSGPGTIVEAFLLRADVEAGFDWLNVGSGSDPSNQTSVIEKISGAVLARPFASDDNMMWISFYSDYSNSGDGFSFLIEGIDPKDVVQPKTLNVGVQATCGGSVQVPVDGQLIIKSPNYPLNYDNNTECTWLITGLPGRRFQMIFEDFLLERGYDSVVVGSGLDPTDQSSVYTTLSGSSQPDNIVLGVDTAWITFTSDGSIVDRGFSIALQNANDCELTLTVPTKGNVTVSSLNFPSSYDDNTYCFWTIIGESRRSLRADIISFDIEDGYDYVDVGVGNLPANLSSRFIHATGSQLQPFSGDSADLWMTFTSDGSGSNAGFQIIFLDDSCGDTVIENTTSGRIESPNYPNSYANNLDCSWTIRVGDLFNVRLTFEGFNLESGYDQLIIEGVMEDGTVSLSGSDLPDVIISEASEITLRFQTDSTGVSNGFALTFEEIYYCPDGYTAFQVGDGFTCYRFSTDAKSWVEARKDCQSTIDGDLIVIENALENRGIAQLTGGLDWWLGFYDRSTEGIWRWVDCLAPNSFGNLNWENPEGPDSTDGDEDCAVILDSSGRYEAITCETPRSYICEIGAPKLFDANPRNISGFSFSSTGIILQWGLSPQRCDALSYFIQYEDSNGARTDITITNVNSFELILDNLQRDTSYTFTISALTFTSGQLPFIDPVEIRTLQFDNDFCPLGYSIGFDYECYKFVSTPATWDEARADCRSVENGDLIDINTYAELTFINDTVPGETVWIGYYDKGIEGDWRWSDCELPNAWQAVNWAVDQPDDVIGNQDCAEMTPDLLWNDRVCNGPVTNGYVCEIYTKNYDDIDQNPIDLAAVSLTPTRVSITWTLSLRYTCDVLGYSIKYSFDNETPKELRVDEALTNRAVLEGLVPNKNYTITVSAISSLGDVAPSSFTNVVTLDGELCPPGYVEGYDYGCYKFVAGMQSWNDARMDCQATEDGDLLIINSQAELDYISGVKQNISGSWWIGFFDTAEEGDWRWVDCSVPQGVVEWDVGQPDDINATQNCGELTENSKINDLECGAMRMYVCEITRKDFFPNDVDPTNFDGVSTSSDSVLLRWTVSDYNCDIKGYKVIYSEASGQESVQIVPGSDTNIVNITGLLPETEYSFKLLAYTEFTDREVAALTTEITQEVFFPCPEDGWELGFGDKCYKFAAALENWFDARAFCRQEADGDLVIIDSQEENLYIQERAQGGDWWIGFYDLSVEGDWRWTDCSEPTPWTVSNWGESQPNNLNGNQHCGQILNDGKYNDWQCNRTMQYICEITVKSFEPNDANPTRLRGIAVNPNTVTLTWRPSLVSCDVIGYRILYNNPLITTFQEVLGGNSTQITISGLTDGVPITFSIAGFTSEVLLTYETRVTVNMPSLDDLCEDGWEPAADYRCYKFSSQPKTWEDARKDCQNVTDGDLVIVETEEEHEYLVNRTLGGDWWIGLYDQGTEANWRWVDCQAPSVWAETNWAFGQPNDLDENQDCGQMLQSGLWNDWNCERPMQYICEISPKPFTSEDDQNPIFFRGQALDTTSIQLNWRPSRFNCEVTGYRIVYEENDVGVTKFIEGGATTSVLLKNLDPMQVYVFFIGAITKDMTFDLGPRSVRIMLPTTDGCGVTEFTMESGMISSPNYPKPYLSNQDCIYTISLPDDTSSLQLNFTDLDLEKGQDFLMIGAGPKPDIDTLYTFTGSVLPDSITIDSSQAWMRFFSDESNENAGFQLMYGATQGNALTGEDIGSVSIVLIGQKFSTFDDNMQMDFAISVAAQLNVYCSEQLDNCLAGPSAIFSFRQVYYTSLQNAADGLEVTFWVSDPSDVTSEQAGLTSAQLQAMLDAKKDALQSNGQFDFISSESEPSPLEEPWVIALLAALGFLVLLLLGVIGNDLTKRRRRKSTDFGSDTLSQDLELESQSNFVTDDEELFADGDDEPVTLRVPSLVTHNVFYSNAAMSLDTNREVQDQDNGERVTDEVTMTHEPAYASSSKAKRSIKKD
ncbi:uncharacterized protein LOC117291426 [Asterias rubens]|uniref:uncharacterized protein LOC117291426 n=1 Tax=Asterias rubens TaxID=7604 RepID=UPI00145573D4|nr:uncharacterized protein LOC117291426 [Asterias rubens]